MGVPLHYDLNWLDDHHTIITDDTDIEAHLDELDAAGLHRGCIPRDFKANPPGCYAWAPATPPLVDPADYASRLADQQQNKVGLLDVREANYNILQSLDQDGYGLCWNFSSTMAAMCWRVLMGLTPVILSPWYNAGLIKGWRDQGGNGDESLAKIASSGVCEMSFCPSYSSKYATAEAAANAQLNKMIAWFDAGNDIQPAVTSAGILGLPGVGDFDDLSHSMAFGGVISLSPFTTAWINSWGAINQYGPKGLYIRQGRGAVPSNFFVAGPMEASQT